MTDERPLLRVVRGDPTAEDLAALVTVLATRAAAGTASAPPRSTWSDPARLLGASPAPGRGAWRGSALPR